MKVITFHNNLLTTCCLSILLHVISLPDATSCDKYGLTAVVFSAEREKVQRAIITSCQECNQKLGSLGLPT